MPQQRNSGYFSLSDQSNKKTLLGSFGVFIAGAAGVLSAVGAFWPTAGQPKFEGLISLNGVGNEEFLRFIDQNLGTLVEINGQIDDSIAGSSALVYEHCAGDKADNSLNPTDTDKPHYIDRWLNLPVLRDDPSKAAGTPGSLESGIDLYANPELVERVRCYDYSVKFISSMQRDFYPSYEGSGTYLAPVVGFFVPTKHRGIAMQYILREEPRPN